jgi:hypothetical protein
LGIASSDIVTGPHTILFDSHVHVHAHADIDAIFSYARVHANSFGFRAISLCIVDRPGDEGFFRASQSKALVRDGDVEINLVPGAQIVTRERIEVLSLGHRFVGENGLSLAETVTQAWEQGAFPVLPWSAGKWLGRRGEVVERFLKQETPIRYGLGDIPMRPSPFFANKFFRYAESQGIPILAGSDPLPISGDERLVASYCSTVTVTNDTDLGDGQQLLLRALRSGKATVTAVGARQPIYTAAARWLKLQCG